MQNIVVGRNKTDLKKFKERATVPLGKHYIQMEREKTLANQILLDINRPHIMLISGKRGSGKSHTMGVISEGLSNLAPEMRKNISTIIFDTMGIFWTMKYGNYRSQKLLHDWNLKPKSMKIDIVVPFGMGDMYNKKNQPVDKELSISAADLEPRDWCELFNIKFNSDAGILIERAILSTKKKNHSVTDIIKNIKSDKRSSREKKDLVTARFESVEKWSLFSKKSNLNTLIKRGKTSVIDLSAYNFIEDGQQIKDLVISLFCKKILRKRLLARKQEALEEVQDLSIKKRKKSAPLVWIMIDEAHEFLPKEKITLASKPLIRLLREGRQPGISMVLATQQPGKIHTDVMTQSDIVVSHRLTSKIDLSALNNIMQTYLSSDLRKYIDNLPKVKGSAIILDDNSEKIFPIQVRPRLSWHGGEDPSVIKKQKKKFLFSRE